MRLLVLAESPPTLDAEHGNGSTMISANVLPLLSSDIEIDLVYFADRPAGPSPAVLERVRSVTAVPLRAGWKGWASQLTGSLPRATSLRELPDHRLRSLAAQADVAYLHGLHTAGLGLALPLPKTMHTIDPWSHFWRERAKGKKPHQAAYLLDQARRSERLEQQIAGWAYATFVVNPKDAVLLSAQTGGRVVAVPNGVSTSGGEQSNVTVNPLQVCFVGSLDYAPNVEALERLIQRVWPLVRRLRPDARLTIAGRHPGKWLTELDVAGVDVVGPVDDVGRVFAESAVAAYVGVTGRGTKNTVSEALAAGCPVVASAEAARGQSPSAHLQVADSDEELAAALVDRLVVGAGRPEPVGVRTWQQAATEYEDVIRASA